MGIWFYFNALFLFHVGMYVFNVFTYKQMYHSYKGNRYLDRDYRILKKHGLENFLLNIFIEQQKCYRKHKFIICAFLAGGVYLCVLPFYILRVSKILICCYLIFYNNLQ